MKLVFIDETGNSKQPDFYGICGVCVDEVYYPKLSREIKKCFNDIGWDNSIEFKARYIFSSSKGDNNVSIDKRIDFVDNLIALNIAKRNARLKAVFAYNEAGNTVENHLLLVKQVLCKLLPSIAKKHKEQPCIIIADHNDKVPHQKLCETINTTLISRNYCLVEDIFSFNRWQPSQTGLCLCDLIGYLASWVCISKNTDEAQKSLFEAETISATNSDKAETVKRIFGNIKNIDIIKKPFKRQGK